MRTGDVTRDIIGERGEWIFSTLMTKYHPGRGFLFRPNFLGEKWPHTDFIVTLLGADPAIAPFFFVQVKATTDGYAQRRNRLKTRLRAAGAYGLASYPAPTYLAGIDVIQELGYIVSANEGRSTALSGLSTAFPINDLTRLTLWDEVNNFWRTHRPPRLSSALIDTDWK
jgi:hypothetical protein